MQGPVYLDCPSCGKENRIYKGKWTIVCTCGHLLHMGSSPDRIHFAETDEFPDEHSLMTVSKISEEDRVGKSVWVSCDCCGNSHSIYRGKWTLFCDCGQMLYLGSIPVRLQFIERSFNKNNHL